MKMTELIRYNVPPEIIGLWGKQESDALLPLQETAVKRYNLFGNGNLLIQAPTSSGKTFIGEMAAIHTALRRKKVVYLVPLKALAEEKYREFDEKYTRYGLRVIISTRDHREFDRRLEEGDFSIAVVVYEKLAQLLVRRPERLEEIELIIADELELLSDPERGPMVELLLTRILHSKCRLVGLSAVIGQAERLADWMRAELVSFERRPVELRYGVVCEGVFRYRTYNDCGEGEERLVAAQSDSPWEVLSDTLAHLVEQGENALVFVKARHESRRGAELLARRISGRPAARKAIEQLQRLDATRSRDALIETLAEGVAFHNSDLSPDERRIVEQAYRNGEISVLVSTSTLATGLNLPARNVFITADKWRYDDRFGMPWKAPILRGEYENMSGRAGRYGMGAPFGRSMLIATTPFDYETLWRRYVEGDRERIEPQLGRDPLENHVLHLVAARCCRTESALRDFLESTLTGTWVWQETLTLDEMDLHVRCAINRAVDAGVLAVSADGTLEPTPFGRAIASKGITIATGRELERWVAESETREWSDIDLLLAAALSPDGRMPQVSLTAQEYEQADYLGRLKAHTRDDDPTANVPLNRLRNAVSVPFFEEIRAVKAALFLAEWIDHAALPDVEETYSVMGGQILAAADQVSWLVDVTAAIAAALGADAPFVERIEALSQRVQSGLRAEALPIAWLANRGVSRNALMALASQGLCTPEAVAEVPVDRLTKWLSRKDANALHRWAEKHAKRNSTEDLAAPGYATPPVLIVDDRKPCSILVDGVAIRLQDKQYRLIRTLAEHPGECVPYDTIYQALWPDTVVEPNQMHFQKRKLLDRIREYCPGRRELVKAVPKRGFSLQLAPDEVDLRGIAVSTAA